MIAAIVMSALHLACAVTAPRLDDPTHDAQMEAMTRPKHGLSDPATAAIAWARYRRMMRWMVLVAVLAVVAALAWLNYMGSLATIHIVIATIAGVGLTVLLAAALMLAVFLSAGSGHDDDVASNPEDWT
jgi:hypothetical protein